MTIKYKQPTFDVGELSPQVLGRTDLEKRSAGLGTLKNFIALAHGPVERRPGLEFIAELRLSSETGRLIPFEFSVDDAYMIVLNNGYFRFFRDGAPIGAGPYEVSYTYTEAQIDEIDTAQSADTLYLAHPDHPQATLVRYDHDNWTLSDIDYTDGPFAPENLTTTTLTPSAVSGSINITASATTGINGDAGFFDEDVGRLITVEHSGTWGIAEITSRTSSTVVVATVLVNFGATTASSAWMLGAWSLTTGYPRSVTFAFDRLCWAGANLYPEWVWLSRVSEYTSHAFDSTLTDASALNLPLAAGKISAIRWIRLPRRITVGTGGAEWWMTDATGNGPITAESKQAVPASGHGVSKVKPVEMGNILVFLQRHGKVVRELFYEYENDSFAGEELSVLAEHLTRDYGITSMAWQRTPYRVLWCVRADGKLLGCTYYREHKITGWHVHETDGWFEDVSVIPGVSQDEVWFIVKRKVNGSTKRYIERLGTQFNGVDSTDSKYLDSYLSLDNRKSIVSVNLTTDVVEVTAHGYSDGDFVRFRTEDDPDYSGASDESLNMHEYYVSDATTDTFKCKDASGTYIAFSDHITIDPDGVNTVAKNVSSISGLSHLEAKSVSIVADGVYVGDKTVSSGGFTLDDPASVIHAGLGYNSDLWTLTPEIPLPLGTSMGATKRVVDATVDLYKTIGMQIGPDENRLHDVQFASDAVPASQSAALFSGEINKTMEDSDNTDARVFIRQPYPLPMTVLAIETNIEIDALEGS